MSSRLLRFLSSMSKTALCGAEWSEQVRKYFERKHDRLSEQMSFTFHIEQCKMTSLQIDPASD